MFHLNIIDSNITSIITALLKSNYIENNPIKIIENLPFLSQTNNVSIKDQDIMY